MKALIILAHGSRRQASNLEIKALTDEIKKIGKSEYDLIDYAYLEIATPTLLQSIITLVQKEVVEITIAPYFLNSGNHVTHDIPAMIQTAKQHYPDCKFRVADCIGMLENMPELILKQAKKIKFET